MLSTTKMLSALKIKKNANSTFTNHKPDCLRAVLSGPAQFEYAQRLVLSWNGLLYNITTNTITLYTH